MINYLIESNNIIGKGRLLFYAAIIISMTTETSYAQSSNKINIYKTNVQWEKLEYDSNTKLIKVSDKESDLAKSGKFISSFINTTNNTKEKMFLGYKGELLKGITTRQIAGASNLYKKCAPSVVLLVALDASSLGSGTLVSDNGEIITNWHVVEGQEKMLVWFYEKELSDLQSLDPDNYAIADVVATDRKRDLALLKLTDINNIKLNPVKFGRYYNLDIAQDVFAIGHPEALAWSFTYGVISQLRKDYKWKYSESLELTADVIQTQTPTNPGNSGGPLFSEKGKLIGINSFGSHGGDGLNFAISINEVKSFLSEVKVGKHKPVLVENTEGTGENEDGLPFDSDGNGINDMLLIDLDSDGVYELALVDENEDGEFDFLVGDLNNDGETDLMVYDKDGNGSFEYFVIDTDFDGRWDTSGVDTNGDLEPDVIFAYTEE